MPIQKRKYYKGTERDNNGIPIIPEPPKSVGLEIPASKTILPLVIILSPILYKPSKLESKKDSASILTFLPMEVQSQTDISMGSQYYHLLHMQTLLLQ